MISYSKIKKENYAFLDELFNLSSDYHELGIAYPRGDLEDIIAELEDYEQKIDENFYIITNGQENIGTIGYILEEKKVILVGPIFKKSYHKSEIFIDILSKFLKNELPIINLNATIYVVNENKELISALARLGFKEKNKRLSMTYDVDTFTAEAYEENAVKNITKEEIICLNRIRELFDKNMPYRIDGTINKFLEYLSDGYKISVLSIDDNIVGFIIWTWFNNLHFGRVDYLCVDGCHQKKGYGKRLMSYAINEILKIKIDVENSKEEFNLLHVELAQSNSLALKSYSGFGFKEDYSYSEFEYHKHE